VSRRRWDWCALKEACVKAGHELFDDIAPEASQRIRIGAFVDLFPHVPPVPQS
jgi:hypothetical protein